MRSVIDAGNLNKPAKLIDASTAIKEKLPESNNPGPYVLGFGDELQFAQILENKTGADSFVSRTVIVSDDGFVNINEIGKVKALGLTQSQLEDVIFQRLLENGLSKNFELGISGFKSKRVFVNGDAILPRTIPYTNVPIFLEDILAGAGIRKIPGSDAKINIIRNGAEFEVSLINITKKSSPRIRLFPGDKIYISILNYRNESVLVVGETGAQRAIPINAFLRPTLSDTIFGGGVLNAVTSDFSQIYVLRKEEKKFLAFHLDITDPSRINLANRFEMRPDDIVFVAAQPLSLYSRTLSQILGSTGLTLQARDTIRGEVGN